MPKTLKTTRLWSIVLAAVLVAGAVSAMNAKPSAPVSYSASSAI